MTFEERRAAIQNLSERDKKIHELAWKCRNDLVHAANNAGRNAELTYGRSADEAIHELENLLIGPIDQIKTQTAP